MEVQLRVFTREVYYCVFKLGYHVFVMVKAASSLSKENKKLHIKVAASVSCGTTSQTKLDFNDVERTEINSAALLLE